MAFPELPPTLIEAAREAGRRAADVLTPTIRVGVTGLAGSGKTVFITALIRNLVSRGRLPFFGPYAEGRVLRAYLEPQPDDAVPRFDYEAHIGALMRDPPEWPEGTRRISQLRVTIEYLAQSRIRQALGPSRVHLDIVDYPGEWLLDLALLEQSYGTWSAATIAEARQGPNRAAAVQWLAFLDQLDGSRPQDEQLALRGSLLFTEYLRGVRTGDRPLSTLGPGRFLMPGDFGGSPLLTFFPIEPINGNEPARGSLSAMMSRRFESYKSHVVRPFFREHFSRLHRQIVLIDVLSPLNSGHQAVADLERVLEAVLKVFRPGANTWLSLLIGRRIDRLLFAATKADHLPSTSHDRLEAILRLVTDRAARRASAAGADVGVLAIAALRATREAQARIGNEALPCIIGVPLPGQRLDSTVFDGKTEVAVFPGDLPEDPRQAVAVEPAANTVAARFLRFRPPRLELPGGGGELRPLPHIRLDRALDFLLADRLA